MRGSEWRTGREKECRLGNLFCDAKPARTVAKREVGGGDGRRGISVLAFPSWFLPLRRPPFSSTKGDSAGREKEKTRRTSLAG